MKATPHTRTQTIYSSYHLGNSGSTGKFQPCLENRSGIYGSGGRNDSSYRRSLGRSNSREKSYSKLNLRSREDPAIKQRLENLMKSASTYKTKACGTTTSMRNNQRVIIERPMRH